MRFALLAMVFAVSSVVHAETVIIAPPRSVVVSAQDHAVVLARRGTLVHASCGQTEGIGFSAVSADHAIRNCCYWGQRRPRDIGVARGPRGWFAVVRYY